jgi:RNA polymerase sigma-70 factor (ECF subfamily)
MRFFGSPRKQAAQLEFESQALAHIDALYGTALKLTRSAPDAEDLVQDTYLKAHRFYESFEAGTNLKAWLFKILTNTFINKYRRKTRERDVFDGADKDPVGEGVMSASTLRALFDPQSAAFEPLVAAEIQRALETLSDEHRMMILLADVEELSYKEISDIVGCPVGTVMSRLHRARRHMQAQLADYASSIGFSATAEALDAPVALEAYRKKRAGAS